METSIQNFSFWPTGKPLDVAYVVDPPGWFAMTQYDSFECKEYHHCSPRVTFANIGIVEGDTYSRDDFVFVANERSIKRRQDIPNMSLSLSSDWVARILEIRSSDEHHFYARVSWMYSPKDLPIHIVDGKRRPQRR